MAPAISAVVVSHNTREDTLRCLASLRQVTVPLEVLVVDNASDDGSATAIERDFPEARLFRNGENVGFSRANNQALRAAQAQHALILNSDAEVQRGAVETLLKILERRADVALVGPRTVSADGTVQASFGAPLTPWAEWRQRRLVRGLRRRSPACVREAQERAGREVEPAWVSASCMLARLDALTAVGLFDEGFFLYEEDVDLCLRLRGGGWRILYTPEAEVIHHGGRSMETAPWRARLEYDRSHLRFYGKHNGALLTTLLRVYLVSRSMWGWAGALGTGEADARRHHAAVFRVAMQRQDPSGSDAVLRWR